MQTINSPHPREAPAFVEALVQAV